MYVLGNSRTQDGETMCFFIILLNKNNTYANSNNRLCKKPSIMTGIFFNTSIFTVDLYDVLLV